MYLEIGKQYGPHVNNAKVSNGVAMSYTETRPCACGHKVINNVVNAKGTKFQCKPTVFNMLIFSKQLLLYQMWLQRAFVHASESHQGQGLRYL